MASILGLAANLIFDWAASKAAGRADGSKLHSLIADVSACMQQAHHKLTVRLHRSLLVFALHSENLILQLTFKIKNMLHGMFFSLSHLNIQGFLALFSSGIHATLFPKTTL